MATTIKLKNGSGAPLAGDLVQGEPALDLTNKRLYTEDSGGTVIEVGTNPGTDVTFADNRKAIFGAGSDLQIYHDGSNSYIRENGTGLLYIGATDKLLIQDSTLTNTSAKFDTNADVSLYYNNDKRLETTSTGIDVTGDVNSDSVTTGTFTSTGIDDNATSTAITIDSSQNTTFAGTITSGDITVADGTPFIRLQDSDGTNQYTQISNVNGNGYIGARNDAADAILVVGGYGEGTFTEWARWSNTGNLTQKNNLLVQGSFTSLGIDDNATSTAITINSSGNLLVGRDAGIGNERLAVKSAALTCTFYSANSTANGTLMSYYSDVGGTEQQVAAMQRDGDIANTNNSYGALSDQRLKSNIVDASSQIDDIMAVQVRSYTLNSTGDTHIGVVAQELEEAGMSGLVKENEEGIKAVKYSVLYMKAIKALQEAVTRIETLEAEVAALKGA